MSYRPQLLDMNPDPALLPLEQPTPAPFDDAVEDDLLRRSASVAGDHDEDEHGDPLEQLLDAYHFHFEPELRLKIKQRLPGCSLGLCLAKPFHINQPRIRMTLKPDQEIVEKGGWRGACFGKVQKVLLVTTHSQIALFSKKINMKWLRLQFVAGYNWAKQKATLDYRITTKWSEGARIKRKERVEIVPDLLLASVKWNMDFALPDIEGHLGNEGNDPVDVQFGRLDFQIDQIDFTLTSPFFRKPKEIKPLSAVVAFTKPNSLSFPPSTEAPNPGDVAQASPDKPINVLSLFGWPWGKK